MKQLLVMTVTGLLAAAGAAIAGLLLAGANTEQVQVIPWTNAVIKATLYVPTVPKGASPCSARHIRFVSQGGAGVNSDETIYWFTARNLGRKTCSLVGRPGIRVSKSSAPISVFDATGMVLPLPPLGPAGFPPQGARFGLAPGQTAQAGVAAVGLAQCGGLAERAAVSVDALFVSANHVSFRIESCKHSGMELYVGAWSPPAQRIWIGRSLSAALRLPQSVKGAVLSYEVRLTNTGARPFRFLPGSCPDYDLSISGSGSVPETLDCHSMRPLAPGASAVFQLQEDLAIYNHLRLGRHEVGWRLDGHPQDVSAHGELEITRGAKLR